MAKICSKLNISVYDVLKASSTKWNFLPFQPGLVGGHCIGVDPYYLSHKSLELKIDPKVILSGRKTNDEMPIFIGKKIDSFLGSASKILFLGITFKEDVPDLRNSKSFDVIEFLRRKKHKVELHDPYVPAGDYSIVRFDSSNFKKYDCVVLSVPHKFYTKEPKKLKKFLKPNGVFFDIKGKTKLKDEKDINYFSL